MTKENAHLRGRACSLELCKGALQHPQLEVPQAAAVADVEMLQTHCVQPQTLPKPTNFSVPKQLRQPLQMHQS